MHQQYLFWQYYKVYFISWTEFYLLFTGLTKHFIFYGNKYGEVLKFISIPSHCNYPAKYIIISLKII